jgi:hypothetical protein
MPSFSERMGLKAPKSIIQIDGMDADLRNGLWNVIRESFIFLLDTDGRYRLYPAIWRDYFKISLDDMPKNPYESVRDEAMRCAWHELYDLMEFLATWAVPRYQPVMEEFTEQCNKVMKRELGGFRFAGTRLIPLTSEEEMAEVAQALSHPHQPVADHLQAAVDLFSDRTQPDYRNSIKESISAVEAIAKQLDDTGQKTLWPALDRVGKILKLHPDLKEGFQKLYSYTNDSDGIRHAMMLTPNLDSEDAKFMLVACSAFVNYLAAKAKKASIPL